VMAPRTMMTMTPGSHSHSSVRYSSRTHHAQGRHLGRSSFRLVPSSCRALATGHEAEIHATVDVPLGDRTYPIYVGTNLLLSQTWTKHVKGKSAIVVTNETIAPLWLDQCVAALEEAGKDVATAILPDGEEFKTLETMNLIFDEALKKRLDRKTTMVALGGGVIGDVTGFAASCYQRGVEFVQVPTTTMALVDSSVGGKTAVNHALGKNMIGAFYQPQCVVADTTTLTTLPQRELVSGYAEAVKYGLIRDAPFFDWLEENVQALLDREPEAMAYLVERSCINKAEVVSQDEKEGGVRASLNLGHTFGHAIENGLGYGEWLHGEAVSAGMVMAADMSVRLGWIEPSILERTKALLEAFGTPTVPPKGRITVEQYKALMSVDKKADAGKIVLVLLKGELGNFVITSDFDPAVLDEVLADYA